MREIQSGIINVLDDSSQWHESADFGLCSRSAEQPGPLKEVANDRINVIVAETA